jgi:hypothetical protein
MKKNLKYLYIVVFLLNIICITVIWIGNPHDVKIWTKEDGIIESLSAIFYFLGIICCLVAISKRKYLIFSFLWLFLCVFLLGEETSWFQRYLNYSVPTIENINSQSEFNIHNLNIFTSQGSPLIDEQGHFQFNFQVLFNHQNLFRIGLFFYFLILPITFLIGKTKSLMVRVGYPNPPALFTLSMWVAIIFSFIPVFYSPPNSHALRETREMLYAFFIFLYIFSFAVPNNGIDTDS